MTVSKILTATVSKVKSIVPKNLVMDSYVWIDLEMTGLDVVKDTILEAACIITNPALVPVHQGFHVVINHSDEVLKTMNSWSQIQHEKSGLISESRKSKISLSDAEDQLLNYIKQHTSEDGNRYIAGNSVYMDKIFLEKYMPSVHELFHYRVLDVSSLKIICQHWFPEQFSNIPSKNLNHRALDDILECIKELKDYQKEFFKNLDT